MSKMKTTPVIACKHCGRPTKVTGLETTQPDEDGSLLFEMMRNLHKIVECPSCRKKRQYYQQQGRLEDFLAGRP